MIEYTIRLERFSMDDSTITVALIPQSSDSLATLTKTIVIDPQRIAEISAMPSPTAMLDEFRKEVIKGNDTWQHEWQGELQKRAVSFPSAVLDSVGREFHAVTEAEVAALQPPPPEPPADPPSEPGQP